METNELEKKLNENVSERIDGLGPSIVALLLYSPNETGLSEKLTAENKEILENRFLEIEDTYQKKLLPKFSNLISSFISSSLGFPTTRKEINEYFSRRSLDEIKSKLWDTWLNQYPLDEVTSNALSGDVCRQIDFDNEPFFYFNGKSGYIFSYRFKNGEKLKGKLKRKFEKLKQEEDKSEIEAKNKLLEFAIEVTDDPYDFWSLYDVYEGKYGENITEMMLADFLGFKMINLDQKDGEKVMCEIKDRYNKNHLGVHGFDLVTERFDDHRWRAEEDRPGGLHFTVQDMGLLNYPVEVQYLTHRDFVMDLFGPNSHLRYENQGKK